MDGNTTGSYNLLIGPAPGQFVNPKQFTPEFERLLHFMGHIASGLAANPEGANLHPNAFAEICFQNADAMCRLLEKKIFGRSINRYPGPRIIGAGFFYLQKFCT